MGRIILIFIALTTVLSLKAGEVPASAVPADVKTYIVQHYPKVKAVEWNLNEKKKQYAAVFYTDGLKVELEIAASGQLISSKEEIFMRNIPESISSFVKKDYPDAEIVGAVKEVLGKSVSYNVEIVLIGKGGNKTKKITFDDVGNVIKQ